MMRERLRGSVTLRGNRFPNRVLIPVSGFVLLLGQIAMNGASLVPPHPLECASPSPDGGVPVLINPPPLLWPASKNRKASYDVRLCQQEDFPTGLSMVYENIPWPMLNLHTELAPGNWFWQYREHTKQGEEKPWGKSSTFLIDSSTAKMVTPTAEAMLAKVPSTHPCVLISARDLDTFRNRVRGMPEAEKRVRTARKYIGKKLPSEADGLPRKQGKNAAQNKKFATWASKSLGTQMGKSVQALCMAYLISGNGDLAKEAIRRGLHVAAWDPNGVSRVNDFSDGACLRAMTLAYDTCFDLLSESERETLREGISARAGHFYNSWRGKLETRVFSAHIWQHILHQFVEAAFATLGEIPEASTWAAYSYELWLNRVPLLGGPDGGWANGNSYFGTNFATLVYVPQFFQDLAGVNLFTHPWYRNTVLNQIYTFPPQSASDGFGDGSERGTFPGGPRLGFIDIISRKTGEPYGEWYIKACLGGRSLTAVDSAFSWFRLTQGDGEASIMPVPVQFDLPQAKCFPGIGVAAMHTDLGNAECNLMLAFRSSPYGAHNHMHADQNSFNIIAGGKRLFANSGYYIAYGDKHFQQWYTHSRGHNTVLIDGKGQEKSSDGYGNITAFLHGERISYVQGDASHAYGNAGLTQFRRHLLFLRPNRIVVYDELSADHPAEWSWMLHSDDEMTNRPGETALEIQTETGTRGTVQVTGSGPLTMSIDNRFGDAPAENWRGSKDRDGNLIVYPLQWHARVVPKAKTPAIRLLAVFSIDTVNPATTADHSGGIGNWQIRAELDPARSAALEILCEDGSAGLVFGTDTDCRIGGKRYETSGNGILLVENEESGKVLVRRMPSE